MIAPMRRTASSVDPLISDPNNRIVPEVGRIKPSKVPMMVVLPAPFGPSSPNTVPFGTRSDSSWMARTSP